MDEGNGSVPPLATVSAVMTGPSQWQYKIEGSASVADLLVLIKLLEHRANEASELSLGDR